MMNRRTIEEAIVVPDYYKDCSNYAEVAPYITNALSKMTMANTMTPTISITRTRRCSVSSPLRFTRTFSEDSLDSLEKNGRKELRRQRIMENGGNTEKDKHSLNPLCQTTCPHLGQMGRSRTECPETENLRLPLSAKRSTGDLSCPPSPTRRNLSDVIGLTSYQQKLLVQCWPNIYSTGANGQFALSLYTTLGNKNAKARQLIAKANGVAVFSNSEMDCTAMHCRITVDLIDSIVRNLDSDHSKVTAYLTEIGRQHRSLKNEGLSSAVWDDLGDAIMDCARRNDAVRKHKELRRAWLAVIAYLNDNLKQGQAMTRASSTYDLTTYDPPKSPCSKKNSANLTNSPK